MTIKKRHLNHNNLRFIFLLFSLLIYLSSLLYASGGYDNGTPIGKGNLGVDLTWNPFNYWPKGQSYAVLSYGITDNFNIHGYYSSPSKGEDNYYTGLFYQFISNKFLDLSSAIGIRKYTSSNNRHLFAPQILYSIHSFNKLTIGGSLVTVRNIKENYKIIGTTIDLALIIPIFRNNKLTRGIYSTDFAIGLFKPTLWKPDNGFWHPTYSFDFKIKL
tara:strand:+ start:650 stop:1297 length:648 start_codon:yes stop_codon:yes gene_type:complete